MPGLVRQVLSKLTTLFAVLFMVGALVLAVIG